METDEPVERDQPVPKSVPSRLHSAVESKVEPGVFGYLKAQQEK